MPRYLAYDRSPQPIVELTIRRQALCLSCLRLAFRMAADSVTCPWSADREEAVSAALEGLCDAARGFDPARGIKFTTYAWQAIRNALRQRWRVRSRQITREVALEEEPVRLPALSPGLDADEIALLRAAVAGLPGRQALAIRLVYLDSPPLTTRQAAEAMGLTRARITDLCRDGVRKLREDARLRRAMG